MASSSSSSPSPTPLLDQLATAGFVIVRNVLPAPTIAALRAAASTATRHARAGAWTHVRVVGKQFPPWDASLAVPNGIWGVQHLLHPSLPCDDDDDTHNHTHNHNKGVGLFARAYFSDALLDISKELLGGARDDELVMELFNLLVEPPAGKEFALSWHRDDIPPDTPPEEEVRRLTGAERAWHAQYNLSLCDGDASLVVVPGSHVRARTETERRVVAKGQMAAEDEMPGQLVVKLDAGDVVFYNNNILHRGVYGSDKERLTLHGSVGHVKGSEARARNVLQHGVGEWVESCDLSGIEGEGARARAEGMRERLLRMGGGEGRKRG